MKSLTLYRPWPNAIAHHGKRIENRTWAPPGSIIGQQLAIHAGKKVDKEAVEELGIEPGTAGAIVAVVTVLGWVKELKANHPQAMWFCGPCGWVLSDVRPLSLLVPCCGAQGLWVLPDDVETRVVAQL